MPVCPKLARPEIPAAAEASHRIVTTKMKRNRAYSMPRQQILPQPHQRQVRVHKERRCTSDCGRRSAARCLVARRTRPLLRGAAKHTRRRCCVSGLTGSLPCGAQRTGRASLRPRGRRPWWPPPPRPPSFRPWMCPSPSRRASTDRERSVTTTGAAPTVARSATTTIVGH